MFFVIASATELPLKVRKYRTDYFLSLANIGY